MWGKRDEKVQYSSRIFGGWMLSVVVAKGCGSKNQLLGQWGIRRILYFGQNHGWRYLEDRFGRLYTMVRDKEMSVQDMEMEQGRVEKVFNKHNMQGDYGDL